MIVVIGTLRFPPQSLESLRPHAQALVEATRREDGCLSYDFAEDLFDPGLIRLAETWRDADAIAAHLKAPHIAPWREAAASLGLGERNITAYDAGNPRPI